MNYDMDPDLQKEKEKEKKTSDEKKEHRFIDEQQQQHEDDDEISTISIGEELILTQEDDEEGKEEDVVQNDEESQGSRSNSSDTSFQRPIAVRYFLRALPGTTNTESNNHQNNQRTLSSQHHTSSRQNNNNNNNNNNNSRRAREEQLPEAYPVSIETGVNIRTLNSSSLPLIRNNHQQQQQDEENNSQSRSDLSSSSGGRRSLLTLDKVKSIVICVLSFLLGACIVYIIILKRGIGGVASGAEFISNDNNNKEEKEQSTEEEKISVFQPPIITNNDNTPQTNGETFFQNQTVSITTSTTNSSIVNNNTMISDPWCIQDPMIFQLRETELYEKGHDPSFPRTYYICPNTLIEPFGYSERIHTFDYTSGKHFPMVIFQPNVNILCGRDGSFENNCTFSGGFADFVINRRPLNLNYNINSTAENITISGFLFEGANNGCNICYRSPVASVTVKDCQFKNNHNMMASIYMTSPYTILSSLNIQNCTFEHNTYLYNQRTTNKAPDEGGVETSVPNIGVILSYPFLFLSTTKKKEPTIMARISNTVFYNNTFLLEESRNRREKMNVTGAVLNLLNPVKSVEITDSCFIDNKDFSSSLILLGGAAADDDNNTAAINNDEGISQYYNGNHFSGNIPHHVNSFKNEDKVVVPSSSSPLSSSSASSSFCVLNYQTVKMMDNGFVVATPQDDMMCKDYYINFDNDVSMFCGSSMLL